MQVAFVNENGKNALLLGAFLRMHKAAELRQVSGDLVFLDSGEILQGESWLFEWEKQDSNCYARKMQKAHLNIKEFRIMNRL